jgi:two-component system nitrogen regulation sensor histidine kinase NtrY
MAAGRRTLGSAMLIAVLAILVWLLYGALGEQMSVGPESDSGLVLLPALSLALVVLALLLAGVLITNLVRLITDRKRGILGSRLRTKLVFFFLALVLAPAIILFSGSAHIIKRTVEAILSTPLDLTRESQSIVDEWRDFFEGQARGRATAIANQISERGFLSPDHREGLAKLLEEWQQQEDRQVIRVTSSGRLVAASGTSAADPLRSEYDPFLNNLAAQVEREGQAPARIDYLENGLLAHAAVRLTGPASESAIVSVGILVPPTLAERLEGFNDANQAYKQFRANRRGLVRFYVTLIGVIFLVTLSIATWTGFYVSKRITVPIQELAAASREISAGNLDVRVRTDVGDEMALLVDSFNDMAAELQESRAVITRSTADLRRSNRELDERRRYIEALLANLSTGVISLDGNGRVTTANPAVETILGIDLRAGDDPRSELERHQLQPLAELFDPNFRGGGENLRRDLTIDHEAATLNLSAQVTRLRGSSGEALGTLVMVEDLGELIRAQRAAAWREVARRIAHEIKNPLTPIQLAAQRLRKKFEENSPDLRDVLPVATASIEREVAALKQLVDEFSRFARMPEVRLREVDFDTIVQSALDLYDGSTGVRFDVDVEASTTQCKLDVDQMRRVLINLIDNAIAAMEDDGAIRIQASRGASGILRVELCDDGPGIEPQDRDKMFSPYFSTKKRGTGLGLAIVHKVVTDHRGTIRVEDNEPRGVRFVIEIPA